MKTTKKGFTLIELIVVIAIIGVLAAILVPSMLGYVKKSKIQGANTSASTFLNSFNAAASDLDEIDSWFADGTFTFNGDGTVSDLSEGAEIGKDNMVEAIQPFFSDVKKIKAKIKVTDGIGIACAVQSGKYYGTAPQAYTTKKYPSNLSYQDALDAAIAKAENTTTKKPATPSE